MGLVVSRFRAEEPLALLGALRARSEELLGRPVRLSIEPSAYLVAVNGLNVLVLERGDARELRFRGVSWLAATSRAHVSHARRTFAGLGGRAVRLWPGFRYRFDGEPPSPARVAEALGGRLVERYPAWAVLRAGLRTPVEIQLRDDGFDLEAPVVIFGRLYQRAREAAEELAERRPLVERSE